MEEKLEEEPVPQKRRRLNIARNSTTDCLHKVLVRNMCADCGAIMNDQEKSDKLISMVHSAPDLLVNEELAIELGQRDRDNLLKNRKLILLVDLDETVVHTTNRRPTYREVTQDIIGYSLENDRYYTKLRPYARSFLEHCHSMFEMHVVSYGQRNYARKMADMLDPKKVYFAERILSRDELISSIYKTINLKHLFPRGDEMVIMIDDRSEVWQNSDAHILVRPYRYFNGVFDINNPFASNNFSPPSQVEEKVLDQPETLVKKIDKNNDKADFNKPSTSNENLTADVNLEAESATEFLKYDYDKSENSSSTFEDNQYKEIDELNFSFNETEKLEFSEEIINTKETEEEPGFSNLQKSLEREVEINNVSEFSYLLPTPVDSDVTLKRIEKILTNIHTKFYESYDNAQITGTEFTIDVKQIISKIKRNVLCNEYIVLSGVIPLNTNPMHNDLFREARKFGAHVQSKIDHKTTVVVARLPETDKVKEARRRELPIVSQEWLKTCIFDWENVSKKEFSIFKAFTKKNDVIDDRVVAGDTEKNEEKKYSSNLFALGNTGLSEIGTFDKNSLLTMEIEVDEALSGDDDDDEKLNDDDKTIKRNALFEDSMDEMAADVEHLLEDVQEKTLLPLNVEKNNDGDSATCDFTSV